MQVCNDGYLACLCLEWRAEGRRSGYCVFLISGFRAFIQPLLYGGNYGPSQSRDPPAVQISGRRGRMERGGVQSAALMPPPSVCERPSWTFPFPLPTLQNTCECSPGSHTSNVRAWMRVDGQRRQSRAQLNILAFHSRSASVRPSKYTLRKSRGSCESIPTLPQQHCWQNDHPTGL